MRCHRRYRCRQRRCSSYAVLRILLRIHLRVFLAHHHGQHGFDQIARAALPIVAANDDCRHQWQLAVFNGLRETQQYRAVELVLRATVGFDLFGRCFRLCHADGFGFIRIGKTDGANAIGVATDSGKVGSKASLVMSATSDKFSSRRCCPTASRTHFNTKLVVGTVITLPA